MRCNIGRGAGVDREVGRPRGRLLLRERANLAHLQHDVEAGVG